MAEADPKVVDYVNHLLKTAIERRWTTFVLEAGEKAAPIVGSGPWEDDEIPGPEPERARAAIERFADLARFPSGTVVGKGRFAMKWLKVTAEISVSVERTEAGYQLFAELATH